MNTPARLCRLQIKLTLPLLFIFFLLRLLFVFHPVTSLILCLLCAWLTGLFLVASPPPFLWFHRQSARMRFKKWAEAFLLCLFSSVISYFSLDFTSQLLSLPPGTALATACGLISLLFGQGVGCLKILR